MAQIYKTLNAYQDTLAGDFLKISSDGRWQKISTSLSDRCYMCAVATHFQIENEPLVAQIISKNSVIPYFSGLTTNSIYYLTPNSNTPSTVPSIYKLGKAVSSEAILISTSRIINHTNAPEFPQAVAILANQPVKLIYNLGTMKVQALIGNEESLYFGYTSDVAGNTNVTMKDICTGLPIGGTIGQMYSLRTIAGNIVLHPELSKHIVDIGLGNTIYQVGYNYALK